MDDLFPGKTFDDFLIRPQCGVVKTRIDINLTMPLSQKINIDLPFVGANMDTVTGEKMMGMLSLEGCFGFLHRNCSIAEQALMVKKVKRRHSYVIENPVTVSPDITIAQARKTAKENKVSGLLVANPQSRVLLGVLSNRDMFCKKSEDTELKVSELMTHFESLVTASASVDIEMAEEIMSERRVEKLPLVDHSGKVVGLITMKDLRLSKQKPYSSKDSKGRLMVGAAIGATGDFLERASELIRHGVDCILIDIAHGHSRVMEEAVKSFRKQFDTKTQLACGNVATYDGALFLAKLGVDAIKVGIGPGKGCRTRLETGFGVPQLQAIREVYCALNPNPHPELPAIPIIADGGIRNDKDIFLAIACGASTVMLGSMLSGTDESPGDIIVDPTTRQKIKWYRGMTSPEAVLSREGASEESLNTPAEGQAQKVPYVGSVVDVLHRIKGHLQSAVSYSGTENLAEAREKISKNPENFLIPLSGPSQKESFDR